MKKPLIIFAIIIFIAMAGYIAVNVAFNYYISPIGNGNTEEEFIVKKGWTHSTIAKKLVERNFIRNWFFYSMYVKLYRKEAIAYPGKFIINNGMSIDEIITTLNVSQQVLDVVVKIPEGLTSFDIANLLSAPLPVKNELEKLVTLNFNSVKFIKLINDESFIQEIMKPYSVKVNNLEGFLFPSKHYIPENFDEKKIIKFMVDAFFQKFTSEVCSLNELNKNLENIKPLNFQQMIILASLIEKETRIDIERKLVAGVYFNRIKTQGWVLNADPTIEYGLKLANRWKSTLKDSLGTKPNGYINWDSFQSPYNTYIREGLPPTAISNPGIKSIKAALNPQKTDYFFFTTKEDGSWEHYFAVTLNEHNKNVEKSKQNKSNN